MELLKFSCHAHMLNLEGCPRCLGLQGASKAYQDGIGQYQDTLYACHTSDHVPEDQIRTDLIKTQDRAKPKFLLIW